MRIMLPHIALIHLLLALIIPSFLQAENRKVQDDAKGRLEFVGGWYYKPTLEELKERGDEGVVDHGRWIQFKPNGSWTIIWDRMGVKVSNGGRWIVVDGEAILDPGIPDSIYGDMRFSRDGRVLRQTYENSQKVFQWVQAEEPTAEILELKPLPRSVDEAATFLTQELSHKDKTFLASMTKDDLIQLHFGFGMSIRNRFLLWGGNTELLESCGSVKMHPDDASGVIIEALWRSVRKENPDDAGWIRLEQLLKVPAKPFRVRQMPFSEFVEALNRVTKEALRDNGYAGDEITFAPVEDEMHAREVDGLKLSHFARQEAWQDGIPILDLDPVPLYRLIEGMERRLEPPSTVRLHPGTGLRTSMRPSDYKRPGYRSSGVIGLRTSMRLSDSLTWESVDWKGKSFEVRVEVSSSVFSHSRIPGIYRSAIWMMVAAQPPMDLETAIQFARSIKPEEGEELTTLELQSMHDPSSDDTDTSMRTWVYTAEFYVPPVVDFKPGEFTEYGHLFVSESQRWRATLTSDLLRERSIWDGTRELSLSHLQARAVIDQYLTEKGIPAVGYDAITSLRRAYLTNLWFYEVYTVYDPDDDVIDISAFVTLDGKVVPFDEEEEDDEDEEEDE